MKNVFLLGIVLPIISNSLLLGQGTTINDIRRSPDIGPGRRNTIPRNEVFRNSTPARDSWNPDQRIARRLDQEADTRNNSQPDNPSLDTNNNRWWQNEAVADVPYEQPQPNPATQGDLIRASQIVARVGSEPILAGDMLGRINEGLQQYNGVIPEEELDKKRWELVEQMLPSVIEMKMVYMDFLRSVPPEQFNNVRNNIYKTFDEKQLPHLVERAKVKDVVELEGKLRSIGSSLEKTRRGFFEQVAAREMIRRREIENKEFAPAKLLKYYRENISEFEFPAESKWEQLTVVIPPGANEQAISTAYRKLAKMGNAVIGGAPFAVVAKRDSDGPNSEDGGVHDWVTRGSLVSEVLDQAIFTLPVGKLSNILKDEQGFHIIRVMDRKDAGAMPFTEAQKGIAAKILEQENQNRAQEYIEKLKRDTFVWNYFQQQANVAKEKADSIYR